MPGSAVSWRNRELTTGRQPNKYDPPPQMDAAAARTPRELPYLWNQRRRQREVRVPTACFVNCGACQASPTASSRRPAYTTGTTPRRHGSRAASRNARLSRRPPARPDTVPSARRKAIVTRGGKALRTSGPRAFGRNSAQTVEWCLACQVELILPSRPRWYIERLAIGKLVSLSTTDSCVKVNLSQRWPC